jgi:hypothetical protein
VWATFEANQAQLSVSAMKVVVLKGKSIRIPIAPLL